MSDIKSKAKSVNFTGMHRLAQTRDTTQAEMMRGIDEGAADRPKGITKVPGGRVSTEVYVPGEGWVKTSLGEQL